MNRRRKRNPIGIAVVGGWLILALLLIGFTHPAAAGAETFDEALASLQKNSFKSVEEGIEGIAQSGDPRARKLLQQMLAGDVYLRKTDTRLVLGTSTPDGYSTSDPFTGESLGEVGKRDLSRIRLNNKLRGLLRSSVAALSLADPDPDVRLSAVQDMTGDLDPGALGDLRARLDKEDDERVHEAIVTALALGDLTDADPKVQLAAIDTLSGNLNPAVRAGLTTLRDRTENGDIRAAIDKALHSIEATLQAYRLTETLFFGLSAGSVLVLAAIGLAITFGVMGVINMAHGELIMLGAYTTYIVQQLMPGALEWSLLIAIPAAFVVSGAAGILIERGVIRFLYGRPLETLLATFGVSLILQQLVRTLISPQNVPVANPDWMSGSWEINTVLSLTLNRLYVIVFCLMVFVGLFLVLKKTALGLQVRAVSQNRNMARAMGIRTEWVDALTFGLGSGIAGVAGVALSQLTNVGPNLGQSYIIDSFMVVVFGGVGNLWGTLVGGVGLGVANKFLEPWSGAVLAKILVLVFIILFIQKRPRGLFPQKGRAAEN